MKVQVIVKEIFTEELNLIKIIDFLTNLASKYTYNTHCRHKKMSFVTALKNLRRRAVESVLKTVGVSETTVDEEYDKLYTCTKENLDDLNECKY